MDVEGGRRAEALDQRHGATTVTFVGLAPCAVQQMARDHALHHLQLGREQFGPRTLRLQCPAKRTGQGYSTESSDLLACSGPADQVLRVIPPETLGARLRQRRSSRETAGW